MYKPLADSTLLRMPKKEIIELLRVAEHNAKVSQEWVDQQAENLKDWKPVVRCKDCRSYNKPKTGWCEVHLDREHPDDYCSYGKRKDGADD